MSDIMRCDLNVFHHPAKAEEMSRYMKYKFPFVGIAAPERVKISKELIKQSKQWDNTLLVQEVSHYYQKPEREYQYLAIDLILANVKHLTWLNWQESFFSLINQKAWWDSVDALRKPLGLWLKQRPKELSSVIHDFAVHESFWTRRVAITVQLQYKELTNTDLLAHSILLNRNSPEFFIQKGIGWALREYSKTDADWVGAFLKQNELMPLSVREASKYL